MNISREISICLPCDIQKKIWKIYTQKYIFPELQQSSLLQRIIQRNDAFQSCMTTIINFVDKASTIAAVSNDYFNISMDVLEDRILDDDWFPWDSSRYSLQTIMFAKQYIYCPQLLKMEIQTNLLCELKENEQIYSLASNLAMLTKMLL